MPRSFKTRHWVQNDGNTSPPKHLLGEKLIKAVIKDDVTKVKRLLADGARPCDRAGNDCYGATALMETCRFGNKQTLEVLIPHCDLITLNACDKSGTTACMLSSENGHLDCLEILNRNGAAVDAVDNNGCSSLMLAASWGQQNCVKYLLDNGCDVNKVDDIGRTALMKAAIRGNNDCLKTILENIATNVNATDNHCEYSDEYSSDLMESTSKSFVYDSVYKINPSNKLLNHENHPNTRQKLIDFSDSSGSTALLLAVQAYEIECSETLLKYGVDVNVVNNDGKTALILVRPKLCHRSTPEAFNLLKLFT